mgnify:CR=1 FL=1
MSKTMATKLDEIRTAIRKFEMVQNEFGRFGAGDTEPDGHFQWAILKAFEGEKVEIPTTAEGWELFRDMKGCSKAATALFNACMEVVKLVVNFPDKDDAEFVDFIKDQCWRYVARRAR